MLADFLVRKQINSTGYISNFKKNISNFKKIDCNLKTSYWRGGINIEKVLEQILAKLETMSEDITELKGTNNELTGTVNELKGNLGGLTGTVNELNATVTRIEVKQDVIYNHTANLNEYHTATNQKLDNIESRLLFNTHKINETELELFKLKKN